MTITVDPFILPERGQVNVQLYRQFEIRVTAEEAQRQVNRWLLHGVSYLLRAQTPTLVIGAQVVWRVPVSLGLPDLGQVAVVDMVDVAVETGVMDDSDGRRAAIFRQAEELTSRLPPYQPKSATPAEFLAKDIPLAPRLTIQ